LNSETPAEKADGVTKQLDLLRQYIEGKFGSFLSPVDFCVRYLNMTESEAMDLMTRAAKYQREQAALTAAAGAVGGAEESMSL
jgi:hypothetical protein